MPEIDDRFPLIKTKRLTLKAIEIEDAHAIYKMRSTKAVNRFIARVPMDDPANAKELVNKTMEAFKNKMAIGWAGILRNGNNIIGTCGFNKIDHLNNSAELGGELSSDFWGKGIAFEAVQAIVNYGIFELKLHRIEAYIDPANRGAIAILEALDFKKEAHFRDKILFQGTYMDMTVYSLLTKEYRGDKSS
ncbi:MAG: GNAT family N-acetyltransferase [Vicingaceae bacterium]